MSKPKPIVVLAPRRLGENDVCSVTVGAAPADAARHAQAASVAASAIRLFVFACTL
jgi:hypothetical protein